MGDEAARALVGPETLPAEQDGDELVREIAMDIGKEVAHHIEVMYPAAVEATSKSMLLSLRNTVYNEIMAAIKVNEEGAIVRRLGKRKKFRRYVKRMRKQ